MKNFAILALLGIGGYIVYKQFAIIGSSAKTVENTSAQAMSMNAPVSKMINLVQRHKPAKLLGVTETVYI